MSKIMEEMIEKVKIEAADDDFNEIKGYRK